MIHPVECAPRQNILQRLYVAGDSTLPPTADPRFYHLGKMELATVGMQSGTTTIGELWVSYHVRFHKPKLDNSLGTHGFATHYYMTAINGSLPFDQNVAPSPGSNLSCTIVDQTHVLLPDVGRYLLAYFNINSSAPGSSFGISALGSNISTVPMFTGSTSNVIGNYATPAGIFFHVAAVSVNTAGNFTNNYVTYTGTSGTLTNPKTDYLVIRIPDALSLEQPMSLSEITALCGQFKKQMKHFREVIVCDDDYKMP
jgi:hypothetical protein